MSHHHLRRIIPTLLLFLASACGTASTAVPAETQPTPSAQPAATAASESLAQRWLAGGACPMPCWEGITPGSTTVDEANALLASTAGVANVQQSGGSNNDPSIISWQWKDNPGAGGAIYYYAKQPPFGNPPLNVVLSMGLALDQPVTLQNVIDRYGKPSHVHLVANTMNIGRVYYFSMVYLDSGFMLESRSADSSQKPAMTSDMTFDYVMLFAPGAAGFDNAVEPFFPVRQPSQFLVPWQGLGGNADAYCREMRENAKSCA